MYKLSFGSGAHTLPKQKKRSKDEPMLITRSTSSTEHYRAVKDYNPEHFSRSGHKRLELPLKEGDIVKVIGMFYKVFRSSNNMFGNSKRRFMDNAHQK